MIQVTAVQVSPSQLAIENFTTGYHQDLKTDIHIKGVFVTKVRFLQLALVPIDHSQ